MDKTSELDPTTWDHVITAKKKILDINLKELVKYRDLLFLLVRRDFVAQYKQSVLGPLWFFIQPLLNTLVFTVIFGNIAKIPTDGIPNMLFYMAGTVVWSFFSLTFNNVGMTFANANALFSKVYFPRLIFPIANVINNVITFSIQFLLFLGFLAYFLLAGSALHPNLWILFLPLLLIHVGLFAMGTGLIVSALTTKYRDLRFLVNFGLQLWMYATPVVYPASIVKPDLLWVLWLNPLAPVVEFFRFMFLGKGIVNPLFYSISAVESLVLILIGLILFTRTEKDYIDRI
jgi:lipopolysaccharide transport system permease protein